MGEESGGKAAESWRLSASAGRGDRMRGRPAEPRRGSGRGEPPGRGSVPALPPPAPPRSQFMPRVLGAQRAYTTSPRWQDGNPGHRRGFHSCT